MNCFWRDLRYAGDPKLSMAYTAKSVGILNLLRDCVDCHLLKAGDCHVHPNTGLGMWQASVNDVKRLDGQTAGAKKNSSFD